MCSLDEYAEWKETHKKNTMNRIYRCKLMEAYLQMEPTLSWNSESACCDSIWNMRER